LWVDSLYLDAFPQLQQNGRRLGLLLHYLPSLLTTPALRSKSELTAVERDALACADIIMTPGAFLQRLVTQIVPDKPCICVTPGVDGLHAQQLGGAAERDATALMI